MSHNITINTEQPYSIMKEGPINSDELSPDPLTYSSKFNSNKQLDYSADYSVSNSMESPVKLDPHESYLHKTGTLFSGKTRRTTLPTGSLEWIYFSDDNKERENDIFSSEAGNIEQKKFVNGLPTVVTRRYPTKFYCVKCGFQGMTRVKEKFGKGAMVLSSLLFVTLLWPCLALVCCSKSCKDYIHECPRCKHIVGKKRFII